jgi:hypothetical protein
MKRTQSLGLGAFTAQLTLGKNRLRRPKRIFYKIKGFPEGKVGQLRRYWNVKVSLTSADKDIIFDV